MRPETGPAAPAGEHLCAVHDGGPGHAAIVAGFVGGGPASGARVVHIVDARDPEPVERALRAAGVDSERASRRDQLVIADVVDSSLMPGGGSAPEAVLRRLRRLVRWTGSREFAGVRISANSGRCCGRRR